jgi:flagellar protein FliO/FliZ
MNVLPYAQVPSAAGTTLDLLRVLFVLGVIVVLIVLVLRFIAKRNRNWGMNRTLRSLGGFSLGTNKSMQIVEWNDRIYVLGIGENVTLLESITEPDIVAALLAEHDTVSEPAGPAIPEWLRKWNRKRNANVSGPDISPSETRPSFEETLEQRLRQMAERRQRVEQLLDDKPSDDGPGPR